MTEPESRPGRLTDPDAEADDAGRWRDSLLVPVAIIALAAGIIGAIVLLAREEQDQGAEALAAVTLDPSSLPVTVPYRDAGGYTVIDVTFGDDSRTVPMILDSGGPTIISEELAELFAPDASGTIATTSVDGQVSTSNVALLPRLSIGAARFTDVGAVIAAIEPGNPLYCITESGFIGSSLMQAGVWQIDPGTRSVTIATSLDQLPSVDGATRFDFARASAISPSPFIEVRAGAGRLGFVVDTGSDDWIAANPEDLAAAGIETAASAPTIAGLRTRSASAVPTLTSWTSAEVALGPQPAVTLLAGTDAQPAGQGALGSAFLSRHIVTIDWVDDAVYLEALPGSVEMGPPLPASATLGWSDGYVVGSLVQGMAETEGLAPGAEVIAIDGRDVTTAPFDDLCRRLEAAPSNYEVSVSGETLRSVEVAPVEDFYAPLER